MPRKFEFSDAVTLAGAGLIIAGIALIYIPAALIVSGAALAFIGYTSSGKH